MKISLKFFLIVGALLFTHIASASTYYAKLNFDLSFVLQRYAYAKQEDVFVTLKASKLEDALTEARMEGKSFQRAIQVVGSEPEDPHSSSVAREVFTLTEPKATSIEVYFGGPYQSSLPSDDLICVISEKEKDNTCQYFSQDAKYHLLLQLQGVQKFQTHPAKTFGSLESAIEWANSFEGKIYEGSFENKTSVNVCNHGPNPEDVIDPYHHQCWYETKVDFIKNPMFESGILYFLNKTPLCFVGIRPFRTAPNQSSPLPNLLPCAQLN